MQDDYCRAWRVEMMDPHKPQRFTGLGRISPIFRMNAICKAHRAGLRSVVPKTMVATVVILKHSIPDQPHAQGVPCDRIAIEWLSPRRPSMERPIGGHRFPNAAIHGFR